MGQSVGLPAMTRADRAAQPMTPARPTPTPRARRDHQHQDEPGRRTVRLGPWRPSLQILVGAAAIAVVLGMAIALSTTVADQLRQTATDAAVHNVETIVRGYVDPTIDPETLALGGAADPATSAELSRIVAAGDIRSINIWCRDGRVVYTHRPEPPGRRLSIGASVASAFGGDTVSDYADGDGQRGAAGLSRRHGHLADLRADPWRVDGNPIGVFEVVQDASPIEDRVERVAAGGLLRRTDRRVGAARARLARVRRRVDGSSARQNGCCVSARRRSNS